MTKKHTRTLAITTLGILQLKKLIIVKKFTVWILLYLLIDDASGYIEEKRVDKYLVFDSTDENKE